MALAVAVMASVGDGFTFMILLENRISFSSLVIV